MCKCVTGINYGAKRNLSEINFQFLTTFIYMAGQVQLQNADKQYIKKKQEQKKAYCKKLDQPQ